MKVVVCWSHLSGYMAAAWRALHATPGVELFVLAWASDAVAPFDARLLGDVRHQLLPPGRQKDLAHIHRVVAAEKPDVLCVSGWASPGYVPLVSHADFARATKVMSLDTPLRGDWRQAVGRFVNRRYLKHFARVVVPGERAYAYARYLGFAETQIRKGLYAVDFDAFGGCLARRLAASAAWPRRFLYVGRYAAEKDIATLLAGYAEYRRATDRPWELVCSGRGPDVKRVAAAAGVSDLGFVAPADQPAVYAGAGAFVMASRYEPWGVAVVEAAAAGLPLVCSTACGATAEVLRDGYNGYAFTPGDVAALARRLRQIHDCADFAEWGRRSRTLAEPHAAAYWPGRFFDGMLLPLVPSPGTPGEG